MSIENSQGPGKKPSRGNALQAVAIARQIPRAHSDLQTALGEALYAVRQLDLAGGANDDTDRARARVAAAVRALNFRLRQVGRAASELSCHGVTIHQLLEPPGDWRDVLREDRKAS